MIDRIPEPPDLPDGTVEIGRIYVKPGGTAAVFALRHAKEAGADPAFWGLVAVHIMHHAANMLVGLIYRGPNAAAVASLASRDVILHRIRQQFDRSWENPSECTELAPRGIGDA